MSWSYEQACRALSEHVNLEKTVATSRTEMPSLEGIVEVMSLMADPQRQYPVIHLTGTNGKTSTARMITSLLDAAGLSVGLYTSPHLERVNERMSLNGEPVSDDAFAENIGAVIELETLMARRLGHFDVLTAAALRWFADLPVHVAVLEVGMLGRYDSTNVCDAQVAVVTNVGSDHIEYAGSLENIAFEKAGIVKPDSTLILGETDPEFAPIFRAAGAREVWERDEDWACVDNRAAVGGRVVDLRTPGSSYDDVFLPLHGWYQGDNAACALAATEAFFGEPLSADVVMEGFSNARSPGRLEVVARSPLVLLDGAHNAHGAAALVRALAEEFDENRSRVVVLGVLSPHDPAEMLKLLEPERIRAVAACASDSPRAVPAEATAAAARSLGPEARPYPSVADAVRAAIAIASEDDLVLVTGSLHVVGEARLLFL